MRALLSKLYQVLVIYQKSGKFSDVFLPWRLSKNMIFIHKRSGFSLMISNSIKKVAMPCLFFFSTKWHRNETILGTDIRRYSKTRYFSECDQLLDNFIEILINFWVSRKKEPGPPYLTFSGLAFARINFRMNYLSQMEV